MLIRPATPTPGRADARVEVDVGLVLVEDLHARLPAGQRPADGPHSLLFPRVGDVQRRAGPAPHPVVVPQRPANRRGVNLHPGACPQLFGQQLRAPTAAQVPQRLGRGLEQRIQRFQHLRGDGTRRAALAFLAQCLDSPLAKPPRPRVHRRACCAQRLGNLRNPAPAGELRHRQGTADNPRVARPTGKARQFPSLRPSNSSYNTHARGSSRSDVQASTPSSDRVRVPEFPSRDRFLRAAI
jgi:hypothetical protein